MLILIFDILWAVVKKANISCFDLQTYFSIWCSLSAWFVPLWLVDQTYQTWLLYSACIKTNIICLGTWHHCLVNSWKAAQTFGFKVFFFPTPLYAFIPTFRSSIDEDNFQLFNVPHLLSFIFSLTVSTTSFPLCIIFLFFLHRGHGGCW